MFLNLERSIGRGRRNPLERLVFKRSPCFARCRHFEFLVV